MKKFKVPSAKEMMAAVLKQAIQIQKNYVREHYPEVTDFDITYDSANEKFHYTGLTMEQIKTLPGITGGK